MADPSDGTDGPKNRQGGKNGQESEPDNRRSCQTRCNEIRRPRRDDLIEIRNSPLQLRTDSANQVIAVWRELPEEKGGSVFHRAVCMRQWREDDVPFFHA